MSTSVDRRMMPSNMLLVTHDIHIIIDEPWHCKYFFKLSKAIYPGAPMMRTRRKLCTSLLREISCPRARRTGSMKNQRKQTGMSSIQRTMRHR